MLYWKKQVERSVLRGMKKIFLVLGVIILIAILANLPNIMAHAKLYSFENNKEVTTETKVVNFKEIYEVLYHQRELAAELEDSKVYHLIGDEVRKGADEAGVYEGLLHKNDVTTSIKVKLPIAKYEDDDKTIEFISGEGEVLEIFENGKWKEFNGSGMDLIRKYNEDN